MFLKFVSKNNSNFDNNVISLEQAEREIYDMILRGDNYNQISQVKFSINGNLRRFNPSQISKIKAKFEQNNQKIKDETKAQNKDENMAKVFELFKRGTAPIDVIIKTRLDYDFIKKSYEQYLEMSKKKTVPEWFVSSLYDSSNNIKQCTSITDVFHCIDSAFEAYHELQEHIFFCSKCEESIPIRGETLDDASKYLSGKWYHKNCRN
jgi:hypothetical protein